MKHVLKRYLKPLLALALLGLVCAVMCGCKMLPVEGCQHDLMLRQENAVVLNLQATEVEYTYELSQPPCGQLGYSYDMYECRICSGTIYRRASDKLVRMQHAMSSWKTVKKATCTQAGEEMRYCTRGCCNVDIDNLANNKGYETRTIAALGHNYRKMDGVPATCTEAGRTGGKKCTRCGHVSGSETIPALGHDWAEPIYTWKNEYATCDAIRVCNRDASHVESAKATVLARGTGNICTEGRSIVYTATFPAGTAFATQTYTRFTQPVGHTPEVIPAVTATCSETGLKEGQKCALCGEILMAQETIPIDPDNHVGPLTPVPGRAATCVSEGAKDGFYCSACKKTVQETIPIDPNNHLMAKVIPGSAATCTEAGLTDGNVCGDCGAVLTVQKEIPALGHTPAETVRENELAATCVAGGSYDSVVYCTVCKAELFRETVETELNPENHKPYVEVAGKEATCLEPGMTALIKCELCDAVLQEQSEIPQLQHNIVDGICTLCKRSESDLGSIAVPQG